MRRRGFTLVEILVVIAIIIILVGTVVAIGTQTRISAHIKQTKATLQNLQGMYNVWAEEGNLSFTTGTATTNLFVYQFQTYAATKRGAVSLPTVYGTGASAIVNDGFNNPIRFENGPSGGIFRSAGPDGVFGNSDDIVSTEP